MSINNSDPIKHHLNFVAFVQDNSTALLKNLRKDVNASDSVKKAGAVESINNMIQTLDNNLPKDIRIATTFYKPENNKTNKKPDFFVTTTTNWLVFPHEIEGMDVEEIRKHKGDHVAELLK
jgi:hypoxanthine-guanine phosphoribosyltransferase